MARRRRRNLLRRVGGKYNRADFFAWLPDHRFERRCNLQDRGTRLVQRTIHIHVMIRTLSSSGSVLTEFTTQLFFDQTLLNALTTTVSPYSSRGVPDTTNAQDSIYSSATQLTLTNAPSGGG
jgi:hypothetical protein